MLLDLYCGAGGAAMGYARAGFEVIGIDLFPQANYPFEFRQCDALTFLSQINGATFDGREPSAIHASPPCHDHSKYSARWPSDGTGHLLPDTRELLQQLDVPWVIENVPGAPMRADYKLCGCYFGLPGLRRERWFETSWCGSATYPVHDHSDHTVTVTGHSGGSSKRDGTSGFGSFVTWKQAMGIDWMRANEITQAIPPDYTTFIGRRLLAQVKR